MCTFFHTTWHWCSLKVFGITKGRILRLFLCCLAFFFRSADASKVWHIRYRSFTEYICRNIAYRLQDCYRYIIEVFHSCYIHSQKRSRAITPTLQKRCAVLMYAFRSIPKTLHIHSRSVKKRCRVVTDTLQKCSTAVTYAFRRVPETLQVHYKYIAEAFQSCYECLTKVSQKHNESIPDELLVWVRTLFDEDVKWEAGGLSYQGADPRTSNEPQEHYH